MLNLDNYERLSKNLDKIKELSYHKFSPISQNNFSKIPTDPPSLLLLIAFKVRFKVSLINTTVSCGQLAQ